MYIYIDYIYENMKSVGIRLYGYKVKVIKITNYFLLLLKR